MHTDNVVVLCPFETVTLDMAPIQGFRDALGDGPIGLWAEDAIEDMVVCLASIEAAWSAGEFRRVNIGVNKVIGLSERTGLQDITAVARQLKTLLNGTDAVAIAAVTARLVRVGETSLATLLEIGCRQV